MTAPLQKDKSIIRLLDQLRTRLGRDAFDVVDHWESDLSAVGVARPDNHGVLVYLSTFGEPEDSYFASLELPHRLGDEPWANHPYTPAGEQRVRGFDALVRLIQGHFEDEHSASL